MHGEVVVAVVGTKLINVFGKDGVAWGTNVICYLWDSVFVCCSTVDPMLAAQFVLIIMNTRYSILRCRDCSEHVVHLIHFSHVPTT